MIELRWLERQVYHNTVVNVLQYRTLGAPIRVWEETIPVWSDWQDVPTVTEGSEESA